MKTYEDFKPEKARFNFKPNEQLPLKLFKPKSMVLEESLKEKLKTNAELKAILSILEINQAQQNAKFYSPQESLEN